jgi:adenylate kinase
VTGTPGTGKTTISKKLSKNKNWRHIELSKFAKEMNCIIEYDGQRKTEIVNMESLKKILLNELINIETSVIIDSHYSHELFNDNEVSIVIVLRKAPWKLRKVLEMRGYSQEKIWENIEAEIMGVILHEVKGKFIHEKIFEIDISQKSSNETILEIQGIIEGKRDKIDSIDWLNCTKTLRLLEKKTCI